MYTITDVNEESHGIYSVEVIPTVTDDEKKIDGQYKDEISVNILRKFIFEQTNQFI